MRDSKLPSLSIWKPQVTAVKFTPDTVTIEQWWLGHFGAEQKFGWRNFVATYSRILPEPLLVEFAVKTEPSPKASLAWSGYNHTYLVGSSIHAGDDPCLYNDITWLVPELRRQMTGTRVTVRLVHTADALGLMELRLHAREIGPYAWTRMGFLPTVEDWDAVRDHIGDFIALMKGELEEDEEGLLVAIAEDDDPEAFREVAKLNRILESCPIADFREISIMRALLTQKGIDFEAVLDLRPGRSRDVFVAYCTGDRDV